MKEVWINWLGLTIFITVIVISQIALLYAIWIGENPLHDNESIQDKFRRWRIIRKQDFRQ